MLQGLGGMHLLIILGIVILLFGATKLPALAKGLGQSINIFKKEMSDDKKTTNVDGTVNTTVAPDVSAQQTGQPVVNPGPSVQPNTDLRK
ncbi:MULTISPECIES: twin-arginine translocase TatA/TatE family subunit [unclassified Curtobacterium]|uniref:twin-arginine translocase TatA/TatE family subunit n=1 Tax=unclassified Curtobacterium TaxID=257496 RepID=UPI0008DC9386|nr:MULTISPECIES: twin-arginine translocase TatA/TatE family subunit [unclassified Curtobacterium]WIA97355.1 twin-arginine translocase TatA/TatE family subunit [Curtobacterium sp. MCBA15_004]WIB00676.1 twin-arginine translocase TatA/TatE family subunit [Curtobacterium sp. MCBA15_012]